MSPKPAIVGIGGSTCSLLAASVKDVGPPKKNLRDFMQLLSNCFADVLRGLGRRAASSFACGRVRKDRAMHCS
jgi:hypothetical protein